MPLPIWKTRKRKQITNINSQDISTFTTSNLQNQDQDQHQTEIQATSLQTTTYKKALKFSGNGRGR
jgi:hypothetical protein